MIEDEKVEVVPLSEIEVDCCTLVWDWIEHVSNNIANEEIDFLAFIIHNHIAYWFSDWYWWGFDWSEGWCFDEIEVLEFVI